MSDQGGIFVLQKEAKRENELLAQKRILENALVNKEITQKEFSKRINALDSELGKKNASSLSD